MLLATRKDGASLVMDRQEHGIVYAFIKEGEIQSSPTMFVGSIFNYSPEQDWTFTEKGREILGIEFENS